MLKRLVLLLWVLFVSSPTSADTWPFEPDGGELSKDAALDLRSMNEKQSGETGFVRLSRDGNSFVRGDGQPIRFWAVGSDVYRGKPEDMDTHCRFLAKLGVNMVRLHATVAATNEGSAITDVNEKEIAGIFRFIKSAKDNGIYVTISPYYGHHKTPESWKLEGYTKEMNPWGAIFIDQRMQEGYKAWTKALYARVNPHTGLAIKDDPTVAILQVHNEDSLFFWTAQRLPEPQMKRLAKAFGTWAAKKHGSIDAALKAWGHKEKADDAEAGELGLMSTWHMTQDWKGGQAKRMRDQTQFLGEFQRAFYADMGDYLRKELGCKQLLNATNWRTANDLKLKEIEKYTYAALDIDAENEYYGSDYQHRGENDGYRIDPDHFMVNESCLHKPLELTVNFKSQVGHPFIVTETSWKNPNLYQTEGPWLISAYQSLGGVDIVYWFSATDTTWQLDPRRPWWNVRGMNPLHKWSCSYPTLMGMFPAASIIYRNGYLKEGDPVVVESRPLEDVWERKTPLIDDNEIYGVSRETQECKVARTKDGRVSRAAFLVGPVQLKLGGEASATKVADFSNNLDDDKGAIRSNTNELLWNYKEGWCSMNAPRAQGVTGFLKQAGGVFKLHDVTIESQNDYASISVVSMDGQPLASSRRILVQVGTTARLTGWETKPVEFEFQKQMIQGEQIVNTGKPPWLVKDTQVSITVKNKLITKATRLDVNGVLAEQCEVVREGDALKVLLPTNTMYMILE